MLYSQEEEFLEKSQSIEEHELRCLALELAIPLWSICESNEYEAMRNNIGGGGYKDIAEYLLEVHSKALSFAVNNKRKVRLSVRKDAEKYKNNLIINVL